MLWDLFVLRAETLGTEGPCNVQAEGKVAQARTGLVAHPPAQTSNDLQDAAPPHPVGVAPHVAWACRHVR